MIGHSSRQRIFKAVFDLWLKLSFQKTKLGRKRVTGGGEEEKAGLEEVDLPQSCWTSGSFLFWDTVWVWKSADDADLRWCLWPPAFPAWICFMATTMKQLDF